MAHVGGAAAARRAHNPKVAGSSPAPATKESYVKEGRKALFYCPMDWTGRPSGNSIVTMRKNRVRTLPQLHLNHCKEAVRKGEQ